MINTVLFDLDGTLLQLRQETFIKTYLGKLQKVFVRLEMDVEESIKALWAGTEAMVRNDGTMLNAERFWAVFTEQLGLNAEQRQAVELACNEFYTGEFDTVKEIMPPNEISGPLVRALESKGYELVLATNPLFPSCAVDTRLRWIGLTQEDFSLVTHYENSTFCKPNPRYFEEVLAKIGKAPKQCLMVGNNTTEDMVIGDLGAETYLVTDCLENEAGLDVAAFRNGTLAELQEYLGAFDDIR
ncbi:MAG: HAD family hydrolase [Coriobacteriia bacterium]|nr:HAD family hydrolase [Coriobacteriia bacterium]MCL2749828.1 HAD family hydrolase [Coriobacteriia bacterium]